MLWTGAALSILAGYILLARGGTTLPAALLVLGYVAIVPLAIWRGRRAGLGDCVRTPNASDIACSRDRAWKDGNRAPRNAEGGTHTADYRPMNADDAAQSVFNRVMHSGHGTHSDNDGEMKGHDPAARVLVA
ncbi:MAG TPA: hypothetical protein VHE78_04895 [Gemmatimonadaceae bacterium]|nr:hypothetical protein [Gemmatimonadaceae bacterium]